MPGIFFRDRFTNPLHFYIRNKSVAWECGDNGVRLLCSAAEVRLMRAQSGTMRCVICQTSWSLLEKSTGPMQGFINFNVWCLLPCLCPSLHVHEFTFHAGEVNPCESITWPHLVYSPEWTPEVPVVTVRSAAQVGHWSVHRGTHSCRCRPSRSASMFRWPAGPPPAALPPGRPPHPPEGHTGRS